MLLRPEFAHLLLAYKQNNEAHLAPWEPARSAIDGSLEDACNRMATRSLQGFMDGTAVQLIALDRETQAMVAGCNFTNIVRGPLQACNLGYSVDASRQGQGLMREVVQAGIAYMFDTMGLHRIMANHMPSNLRSAKLLQSLGFEREGYARSYLQIAGQWQDMVLNARINESPR
jgi:ribosomal-protein-alanine N-acetyltransferase